MSCSCKHDELSWAWVNRKYINERKRNRIWWDGGGEPLTLEGGTGVCHLKTPPFQATLWLWRPTFSSSFPAPETPFSFLKINLAFPDQFMPIVTKFLAPETQILAKIHSRDLSFKPRNQFRRPYFLKPWRHKPTKILSTTSPIWFDILIMRSMDFRFREEPLCYMATDVYVGESCNSIHQ